MNVHHYSLSPKKTNSIDEKGTKANVRVSFLSLLHVLPEHHLEPERAL